METERHKSIAQLAYGTLEQLDPSSNELDLFGATQKEYFRNPQRALEGVRVSDNPVGSGLGIGKISW